AQQRVDYLDGGDEALLLLVLRVVPDPLLVLCDGRGIDFPAAHRSGVGLAVHLGQVLASRVRNLRGCLAVAGDLLFFVQRANGIRKQRLVTPLDFDFATVFFVVLVAARFHQAAQKRVLVLQHFFLGHQILVVAHGFSPSLKNKTGDGLSAPLPRYYV